MKCRVSVWRLIACDPQSHRQRGPLSRSAIMQHPHPAALLAALLHRAPAMVRGLVGQGGSLARRRGAPGRVNWGVAPSPSSCPFLSPSPAQAMPPATIAAAGPGSVPRPRGLRPSPYIILLSRPTLALVPGCPPAPAPALPPQPAPGWTPPAPRGASGGKFQRAPRKINRGAGSQAGR